MYIYYLVPAEENGGQCYKLTMDNVIIPRSSKMSNNGTIVYYYSGYKEKLKALFEKAMKIDGADVIGVMLSDGTSIQNPNMP